MLGKKQRICRTRQFQSLLQGERLVGKFCILYYQLNQLPYSRLGIIASKRSLRLAVTRNWFKRVIREYFRHNLSIAKSHDIVIIARKNANKANHKEIGLCLDRLFQQLAGFCNES